jgi:two-component system nitrogen regulation response regulator GlnG
MAPGQTVDVKDMPFELTAAQEGAAGAGEPAPTAVAAPVAGVTIAALETAGGWVGLLELQAAGMLAGGQSDIMDVLGRQFESALIKTALRHTHGRKNDAAVRLGIGRNTITRKIAELGIDGAKDE